jgi:hypothetical protein
VTTLLNPFGPTVWAYAVGLSTNPEVTARISEWQPTTPRTVPGILFFASALATAMLLVRRGRPTSWPTLAWLGVFFVVGAYAIRGVAWWPLGAAIAIAGVLGGTAAASGRPIAVAARRINVAIVAALVVTVIVLLPIWRASDPVIGAPASVLTDAPSGLTAALRATARPGDRLFNPQPWGSWFEFTIPDLPVAIDSRIELFPVATWDDYDSVASGRDGWQAVLERWHITIALVSAGDEALAERLAALGWRQSYEDRYGQIFVAPGR